jgi:hypothetical protein
MVLAVASIPVLAPANSPIFIGVPGMINIGGSSGTYDFDNVFGMTMDEAVYDPDTADSALVWSFTTDAATGAILVNGLDTTATDIRTSAGFDISYDDTSGGVDAGLTTEFADSNVETALGAAAAATKLQLSVSDGVLVTTKEILVIATADASDMAGGIWFEKAAYASGAAHAGFNVFNEWPSGSTANSLDTSDARGLTMIAPVPNSTPTEAYFGYAISPLNRDVNSGINIEAGKMYRLRTTVYAGSFGSDKPCRFRLRAGVLNTGTFDLQSLYENVGMNYLGAEANRVSTTDGVVYHNIFCPPQSARFDGLAYGGQGALTNNFRFMYDVIDVGLYLHSGELVFGSSVVDELIRPEVGSNGYLKVYGASGDGFADLPIVEIGMFANLVESSAPGWRYEALHFSDTFVAQRNTNHQENGVGSITDSVTSASYASDGSQLELFSAVSGLNMPYWFVGEPSGQVGGDFHYNSAIDYSLMEDLSNTVYYRATFTLSGDNDTYSDNTQVRLRIGNPWGVNQTGLVMAGGGSSDIGVDTTPTVYEVWWLGPDATKAESGAGKPAYDNFSLTIDQMDFLAGGGGSVFIDEVKIECFPVDFFN